MINDTLNDVKAINDEERVRYYDDWQASGLKMAQFCRERQLPVHRFYYWCKRFQKEKTPSTTGFSSVELTPSKRTPTSNDTLVDVGIKLPNAIQLQLTLSIPQLLILVRGFCDATSFIR